MSGKSREDVGARPAEPVPDDGVGARHAEPVPAPKPDEALVTVYLRDGAEPYLDPQTHLWVTSAKQNVPRAMVGEGCRRCADVVIEPFDGAQDRK